MDPAHERLSLFFQRIGEVSEVQPLTADASTREYFRVGWKGGTAVACVYPEPFDPATLPYLDVTHLFLAAGLPVANIHAVDGPLGVIIQEDLGDRVLRDEMENVTPDRRSRLMNEAISLIARIQVATDRAYDLNSIASRLKFDFEKLSWELDYFKEHYFTTFRLEIPREHERAVPEGVELPSLISRGGQRPGRWLPQELTLEQDAELIAEFQELCHELETFASVLCHRDFHAANLMLDHKNRMRIIDHQDARIGSPAYDLVSLLLDRITELPSPEWLANRRHYFLDVRRRLGLPKIDEDEFAYEFRLQTIQRCLKAAGTFSYQSAIRGKTYFIPYIKPMFGIARRACQSLGRFPAIQTALTRELES
ncbi:MAG: phosphotransferase [Acidobacteria bacterium]|nr:phosphotransferase [Acidobacteriota bacterium]